MHALNIPSSVIKATPLLKHKVKWNLSYLCSALLPRLVGVALSYAVESKVSQIRIKSNAKTLSRGPGGDSNTMAISAPLRHKCMHHK